MAGPKAPTEVPAQVKAPRPDKPPQRAEPLLEPIPQPDPLVGMVVGDKTKYRIIRQISAGGMGAVYLAKTAGGADVAVKFILEDKASGENRLRFAREASMISKIRHPNVVRIMDYNGRHKPPYLVMEYLCGKPLSGLLGELHESGEFMEVDRARGILIQICKAFAEVHTRGIVHRDLKPSNIMLLAEQRDAVKVIDFGLANFFHEDETASSLSLTKSGFLVGTLLYTSPEQTRGEKCDHRADIYAVGVIMYEMLCGDPPFMAPDWRKVLEMHKTASPRPPRELRKDIPPGIEAIILRALEKEPDYRFQSMDEMANAIMKGEPSPLLVMPDDIEERGRPSVERGREPDDMPEYMPRREEPRSAWSKLIPLFIGGALAIGAAYYFKDQLAGKARTVATSISDQVNRKPEAPKPVQAQAMREIVIQTTPAGASVFEETEVAGKRIESLAGSTPLRVTVPDGAGSVFVIKKKGHGTERLVVQPGQTQATVQLKPEKAAKAAARHGTRRAETAPEEQDEEADEDEGTMPQPEPEN